MKRICWHVSLLLCSIAVGFSGALAASSDEYITQLKDSDPEVRAKAAYELSCS